jgi:hypothetical protein
VCTGERGGVGIGTKLSQYIWLKVNGTKSMLERL